MTVSPWLWLVKSRLASRGLGLRPHTSPGWLPFKHRSDDSHQGSLVPKHQGPGSQTHLPSWTSCRSFVSSLNSSTCTCAPGESLAAYADPMARLCIQERSPHLVLLSQGRGAHEEAVSIRLCGLSRYCPGLRCIVRTPQSASDVSRQHSSSALGVLLLLPSRLTWPLKAKVALVDANIQACLPPRTCGKQQERGPKGKGRLRKRRPRMHLGEPR